MLNFIVRLFAACVLLLVGSAHAGDAAKPFPQDVKAGQNGWTWVRPTPNAWRIDGRTLWIKCSPGGLWEKNNDNRSLLLRPVPKPTAQGDYTIGASVANRPAKPHEHAGVIWRLDDDNYCYLVKEMFEGKQHILFLSEHNGRVNRTFYKKPFAGETVQLQLVVKGKTIAARYRVKDGEAWTVLGSFEWPRRDGAQAGFTTGYGDNKREAVFAGFDIVESKDKKIEELAREELLRRADVAARKHYHIPKHVKPVVTEAGSALIVTWPQKLPPGIRGGDFHARVRLDKTTGEVLVLETSD